MEAERSVASRRFDKFPMSHLSWGASLAMGLVTLIIGAILVAMPTMSLSVIAILLGVVMVVSGIYYVVRAIAGREEHARAWHGVAGVVFVLVGLTLLRHLSFSLALIGLFIGFAWVIQGVLLLMESFSGMRRHTGGAGWAMLFGLVSLAAGIVVIATPIASLMVLTLFLGCWFIVMGLLEIAGAFVLRRDARRVAAEGGVSVPQQRPSEAGEAAARHARVDAADTGDRIGDSAADKGTTMRDAASEEHHVGRGSSAGDSSWPTNRRDTRG